MDTLKKTVGPAAATAAVNYGISKVMYPTLGQFSVNVPALGDVSADVASALVCGLAVLPGEIISNYAGPMLGNLGAMAISAKPFVAPLAVGVANYGVQYAVAPTIIANVGAGQVVLQGALSYAGGQYVAKAIGFG